MKKNTIAVLGIIAISFAISIYLYPQMPDRMASHWNSAGDVNGYIPRFWGLFLMPFISIALFFLFSAIPSWDPLHRNIEKFRGVYDRFIVFFISFLFYLHILTLVWNLNYRFNMIVALSPAFAILFYYIGILTENAKRNWFIGIRTPWTLSNEKVWDKTHKIGGKLFKMIGVVALIGIILPNYAIYFILIPLILVALYTFIYSYIEYQREVRK